jgi:hypothetical protein
MNLFARDFVCLLRMNRLVRLLLAITLLVSTTGVTLTSRACAKQSGKTAATCQACKKAGTAAKSCCVAISKHLSVDSEFGKPAPVKSDFASLLLPLLVASGLLMRYDVRPTLVRISTPPQNSVEKCALFSTFRI